MSIIDLSNKNGLSLPLDTGDYLVASFPFACQTISRNATKSAARRSGCSVAAKCPPVVATLSEQEHGSLAMLATTQTDQLNVP
jgi:hypothetical protein